MKKHILFGLCACMILLNACTGDKGAVGPQGLQGTQGVQGDKGDKGLGGDFPKVLVGSRTVKASEWIVNTIDVTDDSYYIEIPEKQITKDILDKGMVQVYMTISITNAAASYTLPYTSGTSYRMLQSVFLEKTEGRIRVDLYPVNYLGKAPKPVGDISFRWVITTGN